MIHTNYYLRILAAILFGLALAEQPSLKPVYGLLAFSTERRQRRHSGDTAVRRLRMCNVVMIISNEMVRMHLIHRAIEPILPLCWCVD